MLTRPLIAFDIETIPDPDYGRRVMGLEGDHAHVIGEMTKQRLAETDGRTQYPSPPLHRIVTIAVARLEPDTGRFECRALGAGDSWDEKSQLEDFAALLEDSSAAPRLISWNGNGFDLPIIRYRAMLHGVAMPALYRSDGEWKWNNYQSRYHDLHVDLMDVLCGYGASTRVGLGKMCDLLGVPSKEFISGDVYEHLLAGEQELVREYCKLDVVSTLLVFLSWLVQRGDLETESVRALVEGVRAGLAEETFEGWREIAEGLEGWPTYPPTAGSATAVAASGSASAEPDSASTPAVAEEAPSTPLDINAVGAMMSAAHDTAREMAKNAGYIQDELAAVEMPDALRAKTEELCTTLIGTKNDIVSEITEIEDLLANPPLTDEIDERIRRIVAWLVYDINQLDELVSELHDAKEKDESHTPAWVLVAESTANIHDAFGPAREAADRIHPPG